MLELHMPILRAGFALCAFTFTARVIPGASP
jgi:hypothetical protein